MGSFDGIRQNVADRATIARELMERERQKARERELAGKSMDGSAGGRGKKKPSGTVPQGLEQGRARDLVGKAVGWSGDFHLN